MNKLKQQQMENNHVTQFDAQFQHQLNIMTERGAMSDAIMEGIVKRNMEIVLKMLKKGMSMEDIADITGLTKEEIEQFKTATN